MKRPTEAQIKALRIARDLGWIYYGEAHLSVPRRCVNLGWLSEDANDGLRWTLTPAGRAALDAATRCDGQHSGGPCDSLKCWLLQCANCKRVNCVCAALEAAGDAK